MGGADQGVVSISYELKSAESSDTLTLYFSIVLIWPLRQEALRRKGRGISCDEEGRL